MSTPTPDYGEPWTDNHAYVYNKSHYMVADCWSSPTGEWEKNSNRIVLCINALAGVQDPVAHLASLNDALKEAHRIFGNLSHSPVVKALCPDFAEVAEKIRKVNDLHA
jgi:hypothetical protein